MRRYCVREEYQEYPAPGCVGCFVIKKWSFFYNDGSVETLTVRGWAV